MQEQNSDSDLDKFWFEVCQDTKSDVAKSHKNQTLKQRGRDLDLQLSTHVSACTGQSHSKSARSFDFPDVQYLSDALVGSFITMVAEGDLVTKDEDCVGLRPSYLVEKVVSLKEINSDKLAACSGAYRQIPCRASGSTSCTKPPTSGRRIGCGVMTYRVA